VCVCVCVCVRVRACMHACAVSCMYGQRKPHAPPQCEPDVREPSPCMHAFIQSNTARRALTLLKALKAADWERPLPPPPSAAATDAMGEAAEHALLPHAAPAAEATREEEGPAARPPPAAPPFATPNTACCAVRDRLRAHIRAPATMMLPEKECTTSLDVAGSWPGRFVSTVIHNTRTRTPVISGKELGWKRRRQLGSRSGSAHSTTSRPAVQEQHHHHQQQQQQRGAA